MESKKTAVEWCIEKLELINFGDDSNALFYEQLLKEIKRIGKEMEKEQIGKAFLNGRIKEIGQGVLFDLQPLKETFDNYYNETFKSE